MAKLNNAQFNSLDVANCNLFPAGIIKAVHNTTTIKNGWLLCDGQAVSRTTYDTLFNVIGTTFGAGDEITTFNVPNLKLKHIAGASETHLLGSTLGSFNHVHIANVHKHLINHNHTYTHSHTFEHLHTQSHSHTLASHDHSLNNHNHTISHNHISFNTSTTGARVESVSLSPDRTVAKDPHYHSMSLDSINTSTSGNSSGNTGASSSNSLSSNTQDTLNFSGNSGENTETTSDFEGYTSNNLEYFTNNNNLAYASIGWVIKI